MNEIFERYKARFQRFRQHRQAFNPNGRSWYRMEGDDEKATLYIYDAIGFFGIEAEQLVKEIDSLEASEITLRINSPGGDVFDGIAIYNALKRHKARVMAKVDGLAASMASLIALSGDEVEMAEGSFFMIHKPWSFVIGNADEMRDEADLLDKIEGTAEGIYVARSSLTSEQVRQAMAEETWYTAEEAREAGFAQVVAGGDDDEKMQFDLSVFAHAPTDGSAGRQVSIREAETALREAGMSREQAKMTVARGYSESNPREAERSTQADNEAAEAVATLQAIKLR